MSTGWVNCEVSEEDFPDFVNELKNIFSANMNYFIKSSRTSGKNTDGVQKINNWKHALLKLVTTKNWISEYLSENLLVRMYFIPWKQIPDHREFRCFLCFEVTLFRSLSRNGLKSTTVKK